MATTTTSPQLRTLSLSVIEIDAGFNPRSALDEQELERLTESIRRRGVLQPVRVAPLDGERYRLIDGHRRIAAAERAGLTDVPASIGDVDEATAGLDDALIANMVRADLNPLEEAAAFSRLREAGLSRRGISERLGVSQKLVTERLQLLELPSELHEGVATGEVPPGAIKALLALTKIHPGLPLVAVAKVKGKPAAPWAQAPTWGEVAADPIAVVACDYEGDEKQLPDGVFDASVSYPVGNFTLSEQSLEQLRELCELLSGIEPEAFTVRFGHEAIEQAAQLGAAHRSSKGFCTLLVGQDVADQLAADYIATCLQTQRERAERESEWRERNSSNGTSDVDTTSDAKAVREQARAEREAAIAYNEELGAAVVTRLSRLKVDERVIKILATVDLEGELSKIASRGARYGFPGWKVERTTKSGKTKVDIAEPHEATIKAREYLDGARSAGDCAGRCLAMIVMARLADERAVARSRQAFYALRASSSGLPWSGELLSLIDAIAIERLPEHLTAGIRPEAAGKGAADANDESGPDAVEQAA